MVFCMLAIGAPQLILSLQICIHPTPVQIWIPSLHIAQFLRLLSPINLSVGTTKCQMSNCLSLELRRIRAKAVSPANKGVILALEPLVLVSARDPRLVCFLDTRWRHRGRGGRKTP
jgi:hypothetical protein